MKNNIIDYEAIRAKELEFLNQPGISSPSIDQQAQINKKFLKHTAIQGLGNVSGQAATDIIPSNMTNLPFNTIVDSIDNPSWFIQTDGSIEFKVSGTYSITCIWQFAWSASGESQASIEAQYGSITIINMLYQSDDGGTTKDTIYYDVTPFWSTAPTKEFSVTGTFRKGDRVYLGADHRRIGVTVPTYGGMYITKLK